MRPSGSVALIADRSASGSARTFGVPIRPGITTLVRMPWRPHSAASVRAMPTSPALADV